VIFATVHRISLEEQMTTRTWERVGSATGAAGILLALAGLGLAGVAGRGSPTTRPGWDATIEQIVAFASRPVSGLAFVADGAFSTAFLLITIFFVKLLLSLRRAESGTGWLSVAAIAGGVVYVVFDLSRYVLSTARGLAPEHHFSSAEGATLFDLGNALTSFTWGAIAMLMIPAGLAALRTQALPRWLAWSALVVGLANLVWAWLPPGGTGTPAEFAFLLWIVAASLLLIWRPLPESG
jgi:hypothetical protein